MAIDFKNEVDKIRNRYNELQGWTDEQLLANSRQIKAIVDKIVYKE